LKLTPVNLIDSIDEKTLLHLIQQSFSVNTLSYLEAKQLSLAMLLDKKLSNEILSIKSDEPVTVFFTHDIDWIYPFHFYSIIKTISFRNDWIGFSKLFEAEIYLKNIERLIDFEKEQNIKSIFMLGANSSSHSLRRFDIRYTIHNHFFKKLIAILKNHHAEIGLHSQTNFNIGNQLNVLQQIAGKKIAYHRSHFLQFNPLTLWNELDENDVDVDFSIANAREVGFKNGIPRNYKSVNFSTQRVLNINVVPTIISDNAFFFQKSEIVFSKFKETLKKAKQYGGSVAVLFHPENMIIKPELWGYYKEIIHICKQEEVIIKPQ
jgi:hypothetical protein